MKTILSRANHRNGVSGAPFNTGLFRDDDGSTKLFVDFGEDRFAVLQVDKLSKGDIAFGSNSWRGDTYADEIRKLSKKEKSSYVDGSLYIEHGV